MYPKCFLFSAGLALLSSGTVMALPEHPVSRSDCTPVAWISTSDGQMFMEQRAEFRREWDRAGAQCSSLPFGSQRFHRCYDDLARWTKQRVTTFDAFQQKEEAKHRENLRICYARADDYTRSALSGQARLAQEKRNVQAYLENQQQQYSKDLADTHERRSTREPRVVETMEPSPSWIAERNIPRSVTMPAVPLVDGSGTQQMEQLEFAQALRGIAGNIRQSLSLRTSLTTSAAAAQMQAANALSGSPMSAGIGAAAIEAAGGRASEISTQLENLKKDIDSVGRGAFSGPDASVPIERRRVIVIPSYAAVNPSMPRDLCNQVPAEKFADCIAEQCRKPEFVKHEQCKTPALPMQ